MDKALNLASLAMLDYPCVKRPYLDDINKDYAESCQKKDIADVNARLSIERGRLTVALRRSCGSSLLHGQGEPGNPAGGDLWQGPRNDTVAAMRMIRLSVTLPRIWCNGDTSPEQAHTAGMRCLRPAGRVR